MLRSVKTFEIRKAGPQDAGLLSVLAAATFYEAYFEQDDPHDLAEYIINSFEPALMTEQISAPDSVFFIAFADGRAVGYAKLIDNSREPCIRASNTIELKRIYIVERIWRNGMGESLLKHCIETARLMGKDSIWLGVWQLNSRARPFYQKHGFVKVGTLEFPYGDSVGINDVLEFEIRAQPLSGNGKTPEV